MNNARKCPVCGSESAKIIMSFTPASIASMNPTYTLEKFEYAVNSKEHLLNYSQCLNCGMVYSEINWDGSILHSIYAETIDHKKSLHKTLSIQKRFELAREWMFILRILKINGVKQLDKIKIVDFGCGWGDFLETMNGYGLELLGYEQDVEKLEFVKKRGLPVTSNIEEVAKFGPVDILVMNCVLEHVIDVENTMKFVHQTLKKGGIFIFMVMDYRGTFINRNIDKLKNGFPALTKDLNPIEHVNIFSYDTARKAVNNYGFEFVTTANVLTLTNVPGFYFKQRMISFFNYIEKIASMIYTSKELAITIIAKKL